MFPIDGNIGAEAIQIAASLKKNRFLERKLRKLLLIYRILFKKCESTTSKRLLLQLISIQILQITSSNESENESSKMTIEMQNKLIEYITSKNSNLINKTRNQTNLVSFLKKFQ